MENLLLLEQSKIDAARTTLDAEAAAVSLSKLIGQLMVKLYYASLGDQLAYAMYCRHSKAGRF